MWYTWTEICPCLVLKLAILVQRVCASASPVHKSSALVGREEENVDGVAGAREVGGPFVWSQQVAAGLCPPSSFTSVGESEDVDIYAECWLVFPPPARADGTNCHPLSYNTENE